MTSPTNPVGNTPPPPSPADNQSAAPAAGYGSDSNIDPTGVWTRFLSTPGNQATPQEVKQFIEGLLKSFNVLLQQQAAAAKRAAEQLKKAVTGQE